MPVSLLTRLRLKFAVRAVDTHSDGALLRRFVEQKDQEAFASLVLRHRDAVMRWCKHGLGNEHDAEDACQAVFLVLARRAYGASPDNLPGWLYGIARNVIRMARRTARRKRVLGEHLTTNDVPARYEVGRNEIIELIRAELQRLPPKQREAIELRYVHSHTQDEIARLLRCSRTTVRKRIEQGESRIEQRLIRRGITGLAIGAALQQAANRATARPSIIAAEKLLNEAQLFRLGQPVAASPSPAAALATTVLRQTLRGQLLLVFIAVIVGSVATGGVWVAVAAHRTTSSDQQSEVVRPTPALTLALEPLERRVERQLVPELIAVCEAINGKARLKELQIDNDRIRVDLHCIILGDKPAITRFENQPNGITTMQFCWPGEPWTYVDLDKPTLLIRLGDYDIKVPMQMPAVHKVRGIFQQFRAGRGGAGVSEGDKGVGLKLEEGEVLRR